MSDSKENKLLIGCYQNDIYIKAFGHLTANISFPMREDLFKKIACFSTPLNVFIDLSEVEFMDSTFMGLMVGIERKLFTCFKTHLFIVNPAEIAVKLLKSMKLHAFLKIEEKIIPTEMDFTLFDENVKIDEVDKTRMILVAHKDLSSISKENKEKFKFLEEILEKQLADKT